MGIWLIANHSNMRTDGKTNFIDFWGKARKTKTFINITFNNSKINSIFIKNINFNNDGSQVHREVQTYKAGPADFAAGGKAGLKNRFKIRCLLV